MELNQLQYVQENAAAATATTTTSRVRCAATTAVAVVRQPFQIITTTLLSLLLPLSFLLLARLATAHYLLSVSEDQSPTPPVSFIAAYLLYSKTPTILHFTVSIISVSSLSYALTGKTTFPGWSSAEPLTRPRLYVSWLLLAVLQLCVGVGIEGTVAAGVEGSSFGEEGSFICRLVFFFGLHEIMLFWRRAVVKPVVDDTVFGGGWRVEGRLEKAVVGLSYGGLWWWRLREEVEALVVVAEVKREMMLGIGVVDFVGWWLYYVAVTVGMVRVVKGLISTVAILTRRRESRPPNDQKV
ncbi:uncharacterized protein LOC121804297 [Salvia splendens]|uniref:uncharacterized protein LOC121804297 n=1 Tax=Salvia splendens TaxID=180675 RepID=UPI001C253316|nr:uncharacterized protein LOC121804297 [Salvia splendens]